MSAQQELNKLRALVQQNGALTSAVTNDLPLLAKQGENPDATMSEVYDLVKPLSENLAPIVGLSIELEGGKKNIANSLNNRGVHASTSESLTSLAEKIYEVKNPVAFTVPAETSNELANDFFNTIFKSQGYDQIYESVYETYCGEGGSYVGCLMTDLSKSTNTAIQLIGADAYYIYEEDVFYKTGEGGKLIQFLNGSEVQLTTDKHVWDNDIANSCRIVFYLYLPNSTANGQRENVHASNIDYCRNSSIPYIQYSSNSGRFMYFHLSNPESCVLSYRGTTSNTRTIFFYSNVETCSATMALTGNEDSMSFVNLESLKTVTSGSVVCSNKLRHIEFPNLESITGGNLLYKIKSISSITFPKLTEIKGCNIINYDKYLSKLNISIDLSNTSELVRTTGSYEGFINGTGTVNLKLKSGVKVGKVLFHHHGVDGFKNCYIDCDELWDDSNSLYATFSAENLYFRGLKRGKVRIGGTGTATSLIKYIYINCLGQKEDNINIYHSNSTSAYTGALDIEISQGTRQSLTFYSMRGLTVDSIVNHIFERLADNNFEDDGVTPAPAITITIGSVNLAKLTDEQKAIATNKNYILA